MNNFLTTNEAAEHLGVSAIRVRQLIAKKRLPAEKFGIVYMIKEDDLKLVEDRKIGRPPKAKIDKGSGTDGKVSVKAIKNKGSKKSSKK